MDFTQQKKVPKNESLYPLENISKVREFSKEFLDEMGELVRSIVLFGSNATKTSHEKSDIDVLIILDNVGVYVSDELREAYRIITEKITSNISDNFHLMTVNLSDFWDMSRRGDPVLINILRTGMPIFDRDLFEPMQYLLEIGKVRPTREAATNYLCRSENLLVESSNHIKEGLLDLYYGVVDSVHAALMSQGIAPPSPKDMPNLFKKTFKENAQLMKYSSTIKEFYSLEKSLEHGSKKSITGEYFDEMSNKAKELISTLNTFTKKEIQKKDIFEL